jgi:hypothetical protein
LFTIAHELQKRLLQSLHESQGRKLLASRLLIDILVVWTLRDRDSPAIKANIYTDPPSFVRFGQQFGLKIKQLSTASHSGQTTSAISACPMQLEFLSTAMLGLGN